MEQNKLWSKLDNFSSIFTNAKIEYFKIFVLNKRKFQEKI